MKKNPIQQDMEAPAEGKYPNRYKKGQSGNPNGRPKRTPAELKAVEKMKKLTPEAVDVVVGILRNTKASFYARLQAAEIIFNRAMGRQETYLKVDNAEQSVTDSVARLQSLFAAEDDEEEDRCPGDASEEEAPEEETDAEDSEEAEGEAYVDAG